MAQGEGGLPEGEGDDQVHVGFLCGGFGGERVSGKTQAGNAYAKSR